MHKTLPLAALTLLSLGLTTHADTAQAQKKEKCYGIVKEGKNDCAAADGRHSCAGYSKTDGAPAEWILLPAGTCERIVGGNLVPQLEE